MLNNRCKQKAQEELCHMNIGCYDNRVHINQRRQNEKGSSIVGHIRRSPFTTMGEAVAVYHPPTVTPHPKQVKKGNFTSCFITPPLRNRALPAAGEDLNETGKDLSAAYCRTMVQGCIG